jgi:hypothetical protein
MNSGVLSDKIAIALQRPGVPLGDLVSGNFTAANNNARDFSTGRNAP